MTKITASDIRLASTILDRQFLEMETPTGEVGTITIWKSCAAGRPIIRTDVFYGGGSKPDHAFVEIFDGFRWHVIYSILPDNMNDRTDEDRLLEMAILLLNA